MATARWVSFDCYGTLCDWTAGMLAALEPVAGDRAEALLGAYHAFELPLEAVEPHLSYRQVLVGGLRRAADRERIELGPGQDKALVDGWAGMPVFPEVATELQGLRDAGWRLAVLTNCDDDLFALTAPNLGIEIDEVVTAEQVRSYKPRLGHFHELGRRTGATPGNWVHVANSWVHDMVPASRLGLARIWVDRDRSGLDPTLATAVTHDLAGLADRVATALADGHAPTAV